MKKNNETEKQEKRERLRAENDLLKMKLTAEFGMSHSDSELDEETENEWLNYIYSFEKSFSSSKRIKIYDYIGRPGFKRIEELSENEIKSELQKLMELMEKNHILLDCICDYEDKIIYKFITEELFEEETDDIRIEGLRHCFIYEEFHPNHEYDLKRYSINFFTKIYEGTWNEEFDNYSLNDEIKLNNSVMKQSEFASLIRNFHKANSYYKTDSFLFNKINFDLQSGKAEVNGVTTLKLNDNLNISKKYEEEFILNFTLNEFGFWEICRIESESLKEEYMQN